MKFSLVGGSGGLGAILADQLLLKGHVARSWSRSSRTPIDVLGLGHPKEAFEADCMIYLAWSTTDRSPTTQDQHAESAIRWSEHAAAKSIPFVFVSTVLAAPVGSSEYGRAKFVAERGVTEHRGRNVRVGLVVDDGYPDLLASRLRRLARRMPWLCGLGSWPVFPVSGETAASILLEECLSHDVHAAPILAAERTPTRLSSIMSSGADARGLQWVSGAVAGLAKRYPSSRGVIGRHSDALRGLAFTRVNLEGTRAPRGGFVKAGDWRRGMIPSVNGQPGV
jgi:hypothetical protein